MVEVLATSAIATDRTRLVWASMSFTVTATVDSPTAWNLRCEVREKLLEFLQKKYPQSLPRMRVELQKEIATLARLQKLDMVGLFNCRKN